MKEIVNYINHFKTLNTFTMNIRQDFDNFPRRTQFGIGFALGFGIACGAGGMKYYLNTIDETKKINAKYNLEKERDNLAKRFND